MSKITYNERLSSHPRDVKHYDTAALRNDFFIDKVFEADSINLVYSHYDRFVAGGAMPVEETLRLEPIEPLKADYFCERRELGIINLGGKARITADDAVYELGFKEALYIARETRDITFASIETNRPALLWLNSAPAHKTFTSKLIRRSDANIIKLGDVKYANKRCINQYIVPVTCETCQLEMGLTELEVGSVWNTMPPHTHARRMEVYLYTDLEEGQAVCHLMGEPTETRHLWLKNNQAVISPDWSIHSAAGTTSYSFIWGMAGENHAFNDMDGIKITDLR
jgi:4-deoxy-L-threo-5-hexosulose-uronate ketol-isomerase